MTACVQRSIQIRDASQPSEARRVAQSLAEGLDFTATKRGEIGIIVTEAARNVYMHGRSGEIVLSPWRTQNAAGIDILALDKGPGMQDVAKCMRDGYSTTGTPGTGLGAISRLASTFQIYSVEAQGTAIFARVTTSDDMPKQAFLTGVVSLPYPGEAACGDAWAVAHYPGRSIFVVADGLGHGKDASVAAQEALQVFHHSPELNPEKMLVRMNGALQKTRGAAIAVAEIDTGRREVRYAGVGNIVSSVVANGSSRSMVSHNGTVGHNFSRVHEYTYTWPSHGMVVMHSDGLTAHWDLKRYPGLASRHPALIAGVLYRDASRGRDDATVLVSRESEQ